MQLIEARIICIRHTPEEREQLYAVVDRLPVVGEWVYDSDMGRFACIQGVAPSHLEKIMPVVIATTNDKYNLPHIPVAFEKNYFEGNRVSTIRLRVNE